MRGSAGEGNAGGRGGEAARGSPARDLPGESALSAAAPVLRRYTAAPMNHFLLLPAGSHGDVHPFVAIGRRLREHGHRVTMITSEAFRDVATGHGLEFVPLLGAAEYQALMDHPDLWHPRRGFAVILKKSHLETVLPLAFEAIRERYEPGRTVAVAGSLAMSARIAHEVLGIPHVTLHLQPVTCLSVTDPPVTAEGVDLRTLPPPLVRLAYRLTDLLLLDPLLAPTVNAYRAQLGLRPVRRVLSRWAPSPQRVIGLFPRWFGPVPDAGPEFRHGGFVFFDDAEQRPTPRDLAEFLDAGPPPVVFSFGSAMKHARPYFAAAVEACRLAGVRGVLLGRSGAQIPESLPGSVHHADYAPFSDVFARAAAVVHHGGIGTCAQALRAGVPQLVMPLAYDQGDNAARVRRLGAGEVLPPKSFRGGTVAARLQAMFANDAMRRTAHEVSERFREDDALARTCGLIEEMAGKDVTPVNAGDA